MPWSDDRVYERQWWAGTVDDTGSTSTTLTFDPGGAAGTDVLVCWYLVLQSAFLSLGWDGSPTVSGATTIAAGEDLGTWIYEGVELQRNPVYGGVMAWTDGAPRAITWTIPATETGELVSATLDVRVVSNMYRRGGVGLHVGPIQFTDGEPSSDPTQTIWLPTPSGMTGTWSTGGLIATQVGDFGVELGPVAIMDDLAEYPLGGGFQRVGETMPSYPEGATTITGWSTEPAERVAPGTLPVYEGSTMPPLALYTPDVWDPLPLFILQRSATCAYAWSNEPEPATAPRQGLTRGRKVGRGRGIRLAR